MLASVEQLVLLIGRRHFALPIRLVDSIAVADSDLVQHRLLLEAFAATHVKKFRAVFASRSCSHGLDSWSHIYWL